MNPENIPYVKMINAMRQELELVSSLIKANGMDEFDKNRLSCADDSIRRTYLHMTHQFNE